jgi:hypothetical protein
VSDVGVEAIHPGSAVGKSAAEVVRLPAG